MGNTVTQKVSQGFQWFTTKVQGLYEGFKAKLVQFKHFVYEKIAKLLAIPGKIFNYIVSTQKVSQGFQWFTTKVQGLYEGFKAKLVQFKHFVYEKIAKLLAIPGKIFNYIVSKVIQVNDLAVSMLKCMWNFVKTKLEMVFGSMNEVPEELIQLILDSVVSSNVDGNFVETKSKASVQLIIREIFLLLKRVSKVSL